MIAMLNNEQIILDKFHGSRICDVVLDIEHREYIEVRTNIGAFYITCYDPISGDCRDRIDYGVSP